MVIQKKLPYIIQQNEISNVLKNQFSLKLQGGGFSEISELQGSRNKSSSIVNSIM